MKFLEKLKNLFSKASDFPGIRTNYIARFFRRQHVRFILRKDLIRTGLDFGGWYDTDTRMLYGMMKLLVEYVDQEKCFEHINWDSTEDQKEVAAEIRAIYAWWKDYQNRVSSNEESLTDWYNEHMKRGEKHVPSEDGKFFIQKFCNPETPLEKELSDKHTDREKKLHDEETDMLIRLIKIRDYLWV